MSTHPCHMRSLDSLLKALRQPIGKLVVQDPERSSNSELFTTKKAGQLTPALLPTVHSSSRPGVAQIEDEGDSATDLEDRS